MNEKERRVSEARVGKRRPVRLDQLADKRRDDEIKRLQAEMDRGQALLGIYEGIDRLIRERPDLAAKALRLF